jgi:hypothetical protein
MKASDRAILIGLLIAGLLAAFWFAVLSPKRDEVSKLDDEIAALEQSVAEQEALATYAEQAKDGYEQNYHRLVVLGKAVPSDDDSASFIEQTNALATRADVDFRSMALASASAPPPPPPASQTTTDQNAAEGEPTAGSSSGEATAASTEPTEAAAALLPIGATVGPAGLPVMPYDMAFRGGFFDIADFFEELDSMVDVDAKGVGIGGRLLTVDGFKLTADEAKGFPYLGADLHVTTYVAPAEQGLTGGGTPVAPAASVAAPSGSAPTSTPTPTASP